MTDNQETLVEGANQRFVSLDNCNVCFHCHSVREACEHIIQRCQHPKLDAGTDNGWPEVDGATICDWYEAKYPTGSTP